MVTYNDPRADADAAREALRGLAHATHSVTDPADTYAVLGALSAGFASLGQSLDQLAEWHHRNADRAATDTGSRDAGRRHAVEAADGLHDAATLVERVRAAVDEAWNANGRIAWHPEPQPSTPSPARRLAEPYMFGAGASPSRVVDGLAR